MRIAMWSGPRNLSTAMMYAFGARADFAVMDEPFYAPYLAASGADHPMRSDILEAHETDPSRVAAALAGPVPAGKAHFYQKHMPHHMIPGFPLDWTKDACHVFLLRHPARVVASYAVKSERPRLQDLGFLQQRSMFDQFRTSGLTPLVIDSADIRADPQAALTMLCRHLDLDFDPAMLNWPAGGRPEDGIWASHWYGAVHRSTGFAGPEGPLPELLGEYRDLATALMPSYAYLKRFSFHIEHS